MNKDEPPRLLSPRGIKPGLDSIMRLYVVVFILLIVFGSIFQGLHFEIGMVLTQLLIILMPALWYWRRYNVNQPAFARLNSLQIRYVPIIILLAGSFWILNMVLAAGLVGGLMELGYQPIEILKPPQTFQQYLGYIAVLSVAAGICEEVFFRGTIMPALEEHGLVPAIVFSSLLFALFHGSFLSLLSTFMLGAVIAVVVIKTGSLWGGILYHMLNNFFASTYLYIAGFYESSGQYEAAAETDLPGLAVALPLLALSLAGAYLGLKLLHKNSPVKPLLANRERWFPRGWFSWLMAVALVLFLFMALFEMAIGFRLVPFIGQ